VGEQWDPNAGFYYLRARWMDPSTGRFVSVDPYEGDPQAPVSLHRYLYAGISPLNYVDPSGENYLNMLYTLSIMSTLAARYTPAMVQVVQWANRIVPSSVSLANNLIRAGFARPAGTAAHHIVAGLAQIAYPARSILFKYGVEINEVANGMFLKSATHWGIHSMKYYNRVNALLRNPTSKEDVIKILNFIKAEIEAGRFP
jgi:RHS repeat-associated protein